MLLAVIRRLGILALTLLLASVLIFVVCTALPGDVAQVILGQNADPAAVDALRRQLGTDLPAWERYVSWLGNAARGDFGVSYLTHTPVSAEILPRLAVTSWLVGFAIIVAVLAAVPLGILAAVRRRHLSGFLASAVSQLGLAVPAFWAGILGVLTFAVWLRWLPANGYVPLFSDPRQWALHLVLPVAALALVQASVLTRYVRSAFVEVLSEDYFRTARAVGWTSFRALIRHGLRNAALSVVTVLGLQLSTMLVGAIVVESVFTLPGLGSLLLGAVANRDLQVVQGVVLVLVAAVLFINALVDLSYLAIDPRLRGRGGTA